MSRASVSSGKKGSSASFPALCSSNKVPASQKVDNQIII
jgi:hypothetical protein